MAIETAIYTRLSGYNDLSSLVSTRISPNKRKQDGVLPAITYQRISSQRFSAMGSDSNVVKARFQFDVWAATYASASAVRDALIASLQRWRTTSGATVYDCFIIGEYDLYEDDIDQHHIAIDVEINYSE